MSLPAYLRYPGDYARKTKHLSLTEHGAYNLLLDHYYATGKKIPKNIQKIFRICVAKKKYEIEAVKFILQEFFIETEDGYEHQRCEEDLVRSSIISQKRSYAAQKRWGNQKLSTDANALQMDMQMHSTCNANGYAKRMLPIQYKDSKKEKIEKEKIPHAKPDAFPEWMPMDLWDHYMETRRKKKIPNTQRAMTLLVNKLIKFRQAGHDPKTILENAIEGGWSSLYEPKGRLNENPGTAITRSNGHPYDDIGFEKKSIRERLSESEEKALIEAEVNANLHNMGMQKRDDESQDEYNLRLQNFCKQGIKEIVTRRKPVRNPEKTQK